ncbi:Phosphohydrolase [Bifidobacterium actinocoloniiforme DSM 22766]|uniref:Phosphohydrolase n=2 Tax=Bifidobacterium actinocoloniiforme TaxID=638619 RepID=A0A086YYG0_9BIFI|nr:Phosphohydrolase [Bifidobacterium actinocoloniiforme DSM 22766]
MIPSVEWAEELHRRVAPSPAAYELIHTHCVIIAGIGKELAQRANARYRAAQVRAASNASMDSAVPQRELDADLVYLGGLLHDIGAYRILASDGADGRPLAFDDRYIQHGIAGYELLKAEGVDESIAQFARNHTGVGLTRQQVEAEHLNLPVDDYVPQSLEQELVMYADNYHSKHQPPIFVSEPTAAKRTARYGEENLCRWKTLVAKYGVPALEPLAREYRMDIV